MAFMLLTIALTDLPCSLPAATTLLLADARALLRRGAGRHRRAEPGPRHAGCRRSFFGARA